MPNISDMNIILGQASAIKQMQPVPPLAAENNAQLAAQMAAALQKKDQERVRQMKSGQEAELKNQDRRTGAEKQKAIHPDRHPVDGDTGRIVDIKI